MTWMDWYNGLAKPSWTPAPATIGLIWQILYPIILISFGFVFVQAFRGKIGWMIALPFAINLMANLIFTPVQFGMRNLPLQPWTYSLSGAPSSGWRWRSGRITAG